MKSNKGITLTSLVIYVIVATILIGALAYVSSTFFTNMSVVSHQSQYAVEFNTFNMYFISDVKNNSSATISTEGDRVVFEDGTIYVYDEDEQVVYRYEDSIYENMDTDYAICVACSVEEFSFTRRHNNC